MKELNIEEKAQRYDEILASAKGANLPYYKEDIMSKVKEFVDYLLPELMESEDEEVRKALVELVHDTTGDSLWVDYNVHKEDAIAWLERQGEQKPADKGESNLLTVERAKEISPFMRSGFENESVDKVEPKFKQGDIIKEKETGNLFYVNSIEDFGYTLHYKDCTAKGCTMDFKYEDNYEIAEHTSIWNEDEVDLEKELDSMITPELKFHKALPSLFDVAKHFLNLVCG